MEFGLIGEHLGHSFSKEVHAMLGAASYDLCELTPEQLPGFLASREFRGINVTIPYKRSVIPQLDVLAPSAQRTGAVNTIVNVCGRLIGHNTDYTGFIDLAYHAGIDFSDAEVVILGAGGAADAVAAAARELGTARVRNAVRNIKAEGQLPLASPELWGRCDILVNATPVGMYPNWSDSPVDLDKLPDLRGVLDCIYNPLRTRLVLDAQERGIKAEGGLYMLVAQAVRAREIFIGEQLQKGSCDEVFGRILRAKRNLVLCGMPSCGKSSIGRQLASETGRRFQDTDEIIALQAGLEIPEIFAREGEEGFRKRETAAIESLAAEQGLIIATGGGAILRDENVRLLRHNGIICLIDRDLQLLTPTGDRPLSSNAAALEALYSKRLPYYRRAAEISVGNNGTLSSAVEELKKYVG